ncbi:hypothetical protein, partial [Klebsiella aerogenes]|uniref:hypothetical protein n=1 Tax=Klebsiella aerogenes TaxID=548 RepID=UPI001953F12C
IEEGHGRHEVLRFLWRVLSASKWCSKAAASARAEAPQIRAGAGVAPGEKKIAWLEPHPG